MGKAKYKTEPAIFMVLFIAYIIVLLRITIFRGSFSDARNVNLTPFVTISDYVRSISNGNIITGISNIFGNLIIFLPFGYISALIFPKMRSITRILLSAFLLSLAVEASQYILMCGSTDIDDVFLNTLGGAVGYSVYIVTSGFFKVRKHAFLICISLIAFTCVGFFTVNSNTFLFKTPMSGRRLVRAETIQRGLSEPSVTDEHPGARLSISTPTDTDFNTPSSDSLQSNTDESEWCLILVNSRNFIPDDYEVELTVLSNGQSVDTRIYPALQKMFDAARSAGVYPIVASGYRTAEKQQSLLDEKIAEYRAEGYSAEEAVTKAETWVAVPGTSEHQLGIAVDINADGVRSTGYEVYEWLSQNAYKFGFICRYPSNKTEVTGIIYEPWHYRYVGLNAAAEIQNQGICLEEYLEGQI